MNDFEKMIQEVLGVEGGWSDHPSDRGGKTMYGITEAVARSYGYTGSMRDLPLDTALSIYRSRYWNPLNLDKVVKIRRSIAHELLDTGINQGVGRAAEYLQRSLNALNRQQKDYADIIVDGDIGPATINALKAFLDFRGYKGEVVLLRALNALQGAFYIGIADGRKNEDFLFGWLLNRVAL